MQRLFSMFPSGGPGLALILSRVSVGASVLLTVFTAPHRGIWMPAISIPLSMLLCVGFLTPMAAILTIPIYLVDTASFRIAPGAVVIAILQAIALTLLGPGSYSIDAHLYGRRVVVIPKMGDRNTS
jgi:hypothetical protein